MILTSNTSYVALVGHPIPHSLSPMLHNSIYKKLGLDMVYMGFDIVHENFERAVEGLAALGFLGFNVTIPYKEKILDYLDEIDHTAAAIGAVNVVKLEKNKLIGYNSDGLGFLSSLKIHKVKCSNRSILILGAGGSAKAIGISLAHENPKHIYILNRNAARGEQLSRDINRFAGRDLSTALRYAPEGVDIIINTTPLGMWPKVNERPLKTYVFHPETIVCDIVYNPLETALLKYARQFQCRVIGGIDMLVGQGIKSIEIWTGKKIESSIVKTVADELCGFLAE